MTQVYDVAIIGGGINGCGCAADAALRGLSVILCEQDDLASKTSSSSTKLIHGGLRYLEYYDFAMVKKALDERQILLDLAPHLVQPLPIALPSKKGVRPDWLIRLGLFFYDHLSFKNKLPKSKRLHHQRDTLYFKPLVNTIQKAFLYYDAATDDTRLTIANALQAKEHGATILTQTKVVRAEARQNIWTLTLQGKKGETYKIKAKSLINATGPWVSSVNKALNLPDKHKMTLVKGSHILVPKLYEGQHAYMLQHVDKRIVFIIPYHGYTMIGTTDVAFTGELDTLSITADEMDYLLSLTNQFFNTKIHAGVVQYSWSGVRPLLANSGKKLHTISRDYDYQYSDAPAPAVTIYGGKITTYRQLALNTVNALRPLFSKMPDSLTDKIPLPGAKFEQMDLPAYRLYAQEQYHWLEQSILTHYLNTYGTRCELILKNAHKMEDLGKSFSRVLYQAEVDYLLQQEWAMNVDDILWRRTKLGLHIDSNGKAELERYLQDINDK